MAAMAMPFDVRKRKDPEGIAAGAMVTFTLILGDDGAYAEQIRVKRYQSVEQDPAGRCPADPAA